jgi:hypothetical protein
MVLDECIKRLQGNTTLGAVGWHYQWGSSYPGSYWIDDQLHFSVRPMEKDMNCRDGDDLLEPYVDAIKNSRWFSGKVFDAIGHKRVLCFNGSFYCLPRDLWNQIGGLDESHFPHTWADDLLCYAVLDCGFSVANINPAYGAAEKPGYFRELSEFKWQGIHDSDRHRDDIIWIPWLSAFGLTVSELVLIDLIVGSLEDGSRIASIGDFEQLTGFETLNIEKFSREQEVLDNLQNFDLILCSNVQLLDVLKQRLAKRGVLIVFPPFELNNGLQYHGNLGVHFNTPKRFYFERNDESAHVDTMQDPQ